MTDEQFERLLAYASGPWAHLGPTEESMGKQRDWMDELAWLICLEVTYQDSRRPWWQSRHLHYMLMTQPIRKEMAVVIAAV